MDQTPQHYASKKQSQKRRSDVTDDEQRKELISAARDRVALLRYICEEGKRVLSEIDRGYYNKLLLECAALVPPVSIYEYLAQRCLTDVFAATIIQQLSYVLDMMDAFDQHRVILNNIVAEYFALQFDTQVTSMI